MSQMKIHASELNSLCRHCRRNEQKSNLTAKGRSIPARRSFRSYTSFSKLGTAFIVLHSLRKIILYIFHLSECCQYLWPHDELKLTSLWSCIAFKRVRQSGSPHWCPVFALRAGCSLTNKEWNNTIRLFY